MVLIGVIGGGLKSIKPEFNLRIFFFQKEEVRVTELSFRGVRSEAHEVWDEPGRRYAEQSPPEADEIFRLRGIFLLKISQ